MRGYLFYLTRFTPAYAASGSLRRGYVIMILLFALGYFAGLGKFLAGIPAEFVLLAQDLLNSLVTPARRPYPMMSSK